MKNASKLFSENEIASIESSIAQAENETSAEIVPVVASASDSYDRAEGIFAFFLSLLTLAAHWISIHMVASIGGSWKEPNQAALSLPSLIAVLVISYGLGIALASRLDFLKLPFISAKAMQAAVERRARESFQRFRIRNTDNATGILIYISLYEHRVQVLGDDAIASQLSQNDWDAIRDEILTGFKSQNPTEGLASGIERSGALLAQHFPIQPGDENELPNKLQLID